MRVWLLLALACALAALALLGLIGYRGNVPPVTQEGTTPDSEDVTGPQLAVPRPDASPEHEELKVPSGAADGEGRGRTVFKVMSRSGAPIAGARIRVPHLGDEAFVTDASGLSGPVHLSGAVDYRVEAKGFWPITRNGAPATSRVTVEMRETSCTLQAALRSSDGTAIGEARIQGYVLRRGRKVETSSILLGRHDAKELMVPIPSLDDEESFRLFCHATGFESRAIDLTCESGSVDVVLTRATAVSGVVIDEATGTGIGMVEVRVIGGAVVQTDSVGRFDVSLDGLRSPQMVQVRHPSYAPMLVRADRQTWPARLVLNRGVLVSIQLTGVKGPTRMHILQPDLETDPREVLVAESRASVCLAPGLDVLGWLRVADDTYPFGICGSTVKQGSRSLSLGVEPKSGTMVFRRGGVPVFGASVEVLKEPIMLDGDGGCLAAIRRYVAAQRGLYGVQYLRTDARGALTLDTSQAPLLLNVYDPVDGSTWERTVTGAFEGPVHLDLD